LGLVQVTMSLYEYAKLTQPESIRVMQLEPALSYGDPLSCGLIEGTLSDARDDFEGISYVCGDYVTPSFRINENAH
jgi:hypothetical protein